LWGDDDVTTPMRAARIYREKGKLLRIGDEGRRRRRREEGRERG